MLQIDCTTRNTVYNPVSAQGSWYQHAWGPRDYPRCDLPFKHALFACDSKSHVNLKCMYGDPLDWEHIDCFLKKVSDHKQVVVHTYGQRNISDCYQNTNYHISIDGIDDVYGKVLLGADYNRLLRTLKKLQGNGSINFLAFEHNAHQIPKAAQLAKKFNMDFYASPGIGHKNQAAVIDRDQRWLYDVVPELADVDVEKITDVDYLTKIYQNYQPKLLAKHTQTYMSLRTYLPIVKNKRITEDPLISTKKIPGDYQKIFDSRYADTDQIFLTPDNVSIKNQTLYFMYMNMMSTDWSTSSKDLVQCELDAKRTGNYDKLMYSYEVLYCARKLTNIINSTQQTP